MAQIFSHRKYNPPSSSNYAGSTANIFNSRPCLLADSLLLVPGSNGGSGCMFVVFIEESELPCNWVFR
jgi:hypothetical protein